MSWQNENPHLWSEMTRCFGEGWGEKLVSELYDVMKSRQSRHECPFCGTQMTKRHLVDGNIFCSMECADNDLQFYCIVEGK